METRLFHPRAHGHVTSRRLESDPLTGVVGVGVHVQVGGLLGVVRPPHHTPDLPSLQPHQVREVGVVLAQGRVERGGGVAFLPLHQRRQQRAAAQASHAGAPRKQP